MTESRGWPTAVRARAIRRPTIKPVPACASKPWTGCAPTFALWAKQRESGNLQAPAAVQETLRHWQRAPDLAGVRDEAALANLPASEQQAWQKLRQGVNALLAKLAEPTGKPDR